MSARLAPVLLVLGLVASCASVPEPTPITPVPPASPPPSLGPPLPPAFMRGAGHAHARLTLAAVGDVMLGTNYPRARLADDDGASLLAGVTPWLAAADVTFGNVEGVLSDTAKPVKRCSNPAACYLFRSPARYAEHLDRAGFDLVSFANNHARDFGEEGRSDSMAAVAALGIAHSGRAGDVAQIQRNGLDIAMIAFAVTRGSWSMLETAAAARAVAGLDQDHDIVIVSFHGGAEGLAALRIPFAPETYYEEPRGDVVQFSRAMVDAGADIVLGHGPHVVRAMERYRDRLIAYSLGNFATYWGISVSGQKGLAPVLEVTVNGFGEFQAGRIYSARQVRPLGPEPDPKDRALHMIRALSIADFGTPGLSFGPDGALSEAPRQRPYRGAAPN
ncbi:MAG: CapA family protein [Pseudomonadota bacterium]